MTTDHPATEPRHLDPNGESFVCNCPDHTETAQGAAPLDTKRLAEWFHNKWEAQGIACMHPHDCMADAADVAEWMGAAPRAEGHCEHPQSEHGIFGCAMPDCPCETPHGRAAPRAEDFAHDAITLDRIPIRAAPRAEERYCVHDELPDDCRVCSEVGDMMPERAAPRAGCVTDQTPHVCRRCDTTGFYGAEPRAERLDNLRKAAVAVYHGRIGFENHHDPTILALGAVLYPYRARQADEQD